MLFTTKTKLTVEKQQIYNIKVQADQMERFLEMCTVNSRKIKKIVATSDPKWKIVTFEVKYRWIQISSLAKEYGVNVQQDNMLETYSEENALTSISYDNNYEDYQIQNIKYQRISKLTRDMAEFGLIEDFALLDRINLSADLHRDENYIVLALKIEIAKLENRIKKDEILLKNKKDLLTKILDKLNRR